MRLDAEAIVVGAGPAGATAARTLANRGVHTLLLDRARFPRHKPCGGAITTRALNRFPYLRGVFDAIPARWISRLTLEGPGGGALTMQSHTPAVVTIRRVEFDAQLVSLARSAGAQLIEDADVTGAAYREQAVEITTRDRRVFRAPFVVACDGVHGVVARRLAVRTPWPRTSLAIDMMEEAPIGRLRAVDQDTLWVSYGFAAPAADGRSPTKGYAYVFPKRDHVNVGLGYLVDDFRSASPGAAYSVHAAFVKQLSQRRLLDGHSSRDCFTPFLIPVGGPAGVTEAPRLLIAGDAGGFVNGFTAEGIYYAMVSGDLAGQAAADAIRQGEAVPRDYRRAWQREIGLELRESVTIQKFLFCNPARIDALVDGGRRHPPLAEAVGRWAAGDVPYSGLRRTFALRHPRLAFAAATVILQALRERVANKDAASPSN